LIRSVTFMLFATIAGISVMVAAAAPTTPPALDTAGSLAKIQELVEQGQHRRALDMAVVLTKRDPENADAWRSRGMAKRAVGDLAGALADYSRALELNPRNVRALNGRALTKIDLKDLQGALADVDRAIALDPTYANSFDTSAKVRMELKDYRRAVSDESRAIELSPKFSNYWVMRGVILREMGDAAAAVKDHTEALALNPRNAFAYYNRGLAYLNLKHYDKAIEDSNQALTFGYPNKKDLYNNRGLAYQGKGSVTEAMQDFEKAISLDPSYSKAVNNLAKLRATGPSVGPSGSARPAATTAAKATPQLAVSTNAKRPAPATGIRVSGLSTPFPVFSKPDEDTLWNKPSPGGFSPEREGAAVRLASMPPMTETTKQLEFADMGLALEGLRRLAGPMTTDEEKRFHAKWQPYFDFPTPESVDYFKKVAPVLSELQATGALVARAAQDFDASWTDAVAAHAVGDSVGTAAALKSAYRHAKVLKSANVRLADISKRAEAMGNPPNPVEAKKKAKARFMKYLADQRRGRIAYLWRVAQCVADSFNRPLELSLGGAITADKFAKVDTVYKQSYPDEKPWIEWLEKGKSGIEPVTYTAPPNETAREANELVTQLIGGYWVPILWEGHGFQAHPERAAQDKIFHETLPERAAQSYLDGKALYAPKQPPPAQPPPSKSADPSAQAKNDQAKRKAAEEARKRAEEEAKLKADAIAEKETWIAVIQRNLARDQAEYDKETNAQRKADLAARIRNNLSEIQHEKDLLHFIQTGDSIHARTVGDQYCSDLMALRTEEQIKEIEETRRNAELAHKLQVEAAERIQQTLGNMSNRGDPAQIAKLKDFIERNLTETDIVQGNVEKARKVARAVFDSVQGYQQGQAAAHDERAITFEELEVGSRRIRTGASVSLAVVSLGAPAYFAATAGVAEAASSLTALTVTNAAYGFGTGAAEGGLVEGVRQAVAQTSLPGMAASEFIAGYSSGGFLTEGGLTGGAERAIEAFIGGKLVEAAAGKVGVIYSKYSKRGSPTAGVPENPPMTVKEALESKTFEKIKANAYLDKQRLVDVNQRIRTAKARGDAKEAERLGLERTAMIEKMNDNFYTKRLLKADGKNARAGKGNPADAELEKDFAGTMDKAYREKVNPEFTKRITDRSIDYHWEKMKVGSGRWERAGEVEFKEFRHSGAEDTINTDHDFGIKERPNEQGVVYRLVRGNKPVGVQAKGEKPFNLEDATEELQGIYEKVYREKLKGDPKKAMQQITCSRSGDAYKDLIVTRLTEDAQNFTRINKGWIEQAAEVSAHKVGGGSGGSVEQVLLKKIDAANQTAKDVEKRLIPMLKSVKAPPDDIARFEQIQKTLSEVEKDPVGASRKLKLLTGCDSISEISSIVSKKFVGAGKLANVPAK
jgi:tetratricopeptide (TPR) repeat protein